MGSEMAMSELDWYEPLFVEPDVSEERKEAQMRLSNITQPIGTTVLIVTLAAGVCIWQGWINPIGLVFGADDISNSIQDEQEQLLVNQMLRYCKPSLLHRVGNGFDKGTCMEKLAAASRYIQEKHGDLIAGYESDLQAATDANDRRFRSSLANIEKLEGGDTQ